jgi:hypothetical protein
MFQDQKNIHPGGIRTGGGRDDHYATPPGQQGFCFTQSRVILFFILRQKIERKLGILTYVNICIGAI